MERFKFRSFPLRKEGPVPLAAAGILGGTSLLGSIIGAVSANDMQSGNIDIQREENQKNRDFQAQQAELARHFTTDERIAQQLYQSQQWRTQFEAEKNAQSPVYQSAQLQHAGINPAVYFSRSASFQGGQSPSVSAPSGAQSPLPQGSSGLSSIAPIVPNFPQLISSAADLIGSISQAKKVGAEIPNIEAGTNLIYEQLLGQKLMNDYKAFENEMAKQKIPVEIRKLIAEEKELTSLAALNYSQGSKFDKEQELMDTQIALNKALENYHGKNADWLSEQIVDLRQTRDARIASLRASAHRDEAVAQTEDAFRPVRGDILQIQKDLEDNKLNFDDKTFANRVQEIANRVEFGKLSVLNQSIDQKDKAAYNSLQRVIRGHYDKSDLRTVWDLMTGKYDAEFLKTPSSVLP